jgi:hypothetical protein
MDGDFEASVEPHLAVVLKMNDREGEPRVLSFAPIYPSNVFLRRQCTSRDLHTPEQFSVMSSIF